MHTVLMPNSYLIFLMHMLHHIDFKIAAGVYLVEVAREYFTTAQLRVVGNIESHFPLFNELLFSGVFGQDSWISRFCKPMTVIITSSTCVSDGLSGLDDSVFKGLCTEWSPERSGISGGASWAGSCGCFSETSNAGTCCSGSGTLGSSTGLVTFAFLLGFASTAWFMRDQYKYKSIRR